MTREKAGYKKGYFLGIQLNLCIFCSHVMCSVKIFQSNKNIAQYNLLIHACYKHIILFSIIYVYKLIYTFRRKFHVPS